MVERIFLGWEEPFLHLAANWLLQRRDELPGMLVLVPTAQSGRRLRETLAELSGSVLSPRVCTPGNLLQLNDPTIAADWIERLAWAEVLENIRDWSPFSELFPENPGDDTQWGGNLAAEFCQLRKSLQDNGLTLTTAAFRLRGTVEEERWNALSQLEEMVEEKLGSWKFRSRSRALSSGLQLPHAERLVLAGIPGVPPLLGAALTHASRPVTALIGAPEQEAAEFSELGMPLESWATRTLPWPDGPFGSVTLAADPGQQALEAVRLAAKSTLPSDQIALGSADAETGEELERAFTRAGWQAFHPAAQTVDQGLIRWFQVWNQWLHLPTLASMADLLALPETATLVGGRLAQKAWALSKIRDRWMVQFVDELDRRVTTAGFRSEQENQDAFEVLEAAKLLDSRRNKLMGQAFVPELRRLLEQLSRSSALCGEQAASMLEWLNSATQLIQSLSRSARSWIDLMISEQGSAILQPPLDRVIDVQGWLELFHEPGSHLILCGMNEGKVPASSGGEPWLSETIRQRIGLPLQVERAARDAYLFTSMIEMRRKNGRADILCGKVGAGGESLLPSRLLLAAGREELPDRVRQLFQELEPPEAGLRWHADWQWQPRIATPPSRLHVTALADYLRCPFRFYLKHVLLMQRPDPNRTEWNQRDFGNVAHEVVERWGRDEEARNSTRAEEIQKWLSACLDRVVAEWFGKKIPLAVRIQTESMRQRLTWMAAVQAEQREAGWRILDVERSVQIMVNETPIRAKIDRIDRHEGDGRLRVIDYKTGKVWGVDRSHRTKITSSTTPPLHLGEDTPAFVDVESRGKISQHLWTNLQLPLYAAALVENGEPLPTPCYFTLGGTEADVGLHEWSDFEEADLSSALDCAGWVAGQISQNIFWPPAEKVIYDDYSILAAGKSLEEMTRPITEWQRQEPSEVKA